jgi:hypothetical protein
MAKRSLMFQEHFVLETEPRFPGIEESVSAVGG